MRKFIIKLFGKWYIISTRSIPTDRYGIRHIDNMLISYCDIMYDTVTDRFIKNRYGDNALAMLETERLSAWFAGKTDIDELHDMSSENLDKLQNDYYA